jgi:hypothetical protein
LKKTKKNKKNKTEMWIYTHIISSSQ